MSGVARGQEVRLAGQGSELDYFRSLSISRFSAAFSSRNLRTSALRLSQSAFFTVIVSAGLDGSAGVAPAGGD